ncbi:hypothetical protein GCM10027579_05510 [Calidifontibacter terrae]
MLTGSVLAVTGATGWAAWPRAKHPRDIPLYSATVALGISPDDPDANAGADNRTLITPDQIGQLVPDTRVVAAASDVDTLVATERAMIGSAPAWTRQGPYADATRSALQDLHVLSHGLASPVAGWSPLWRYTWPRDASVGAVAQSLTGGADLALATLAYLQRVQPANGWFEARYVPGTTRSPDHRERQLDGTGWVLWATDRVAGQFAEPRTVATQLAPMITRSVDRILTATIDGLPAPSPDYWEVDERGITLATCAVLAAGLESAIRLLSLLGDTDRARRATAAGKRLDAAIADTFGAEGYPRHLGKDDPDIGAAFLLPPFRDAIDQRPLQALRANLPRLKRPAGGYAPGSSWRPDGISWTPETATVAAAFAFSGRVTEAELLLQWLADHRTVGGSYPEKVLETGTPAAVAPLSWTAASVVLAAKGLADQSLPAI